MGILISVLIFLFSIPIPAFAFTYWVSSTGASSWATCKSNTDPGENYCSRATAMSSAVAGDVVYFKGGTYTMAAYGTGIAPVNSGSVGSVITFQAAPGETPIINGASTAYGLYLSGDSYIKIDGFTIQDIGYWGYIIGGSHYNEITNCTFTSTAGNEVGGGIKLNGTSCATHDCWNTHNLFHHNVFSKRQAADACSEFVDLIRIGEAYSAADSPLAVQDNYNTIEDNNFSHTAHTIIDNYGQYNVIARNVSHNEPWRDGCTGWIDNYWTSASTVTIGTGSKILVINTGASLTAGQTIGMVYTEDYSKVMNGTVTSYNSTTGDLVINALYSGGSGSYSTWIVARGQVPYYTTSAYNGLYGHRNFQVSDDFGREGLYNLYESNRTGHGGTNPANDGAEGICVAAPRNIIRYNSIYNSMSSGMYFKYAKADPYPLGVGISHSWGAAWNAIYNNTIYHNGYGWDPTLYGWLNMSYNGRGIAQYNTNGTGTTGNEIRNNIVYDNIGDICRLGRSLPCSSQSWDYVGPNWTSSNGDPLFINADLGNATSSTLPNLNLTSSSPAINGASYLTSANGSGSTSSTLIVDNALFFQDGTWGSDMARGVTFFPDWIAIGTVTNSIAISSIDYATNTITLASPTTWADNAPIWLYKKSDGTQVLYGTAPDYGAYEYFPATLTEVTPVVTPSSNVYPLYTFSSEMAGTISYTGSCIGGNETTAEIGNTTVRFGPLASGTYTDCYVSVGGSNPLHLTNFTIVGPSVTITLPVAGVTVGTITLEAICTCTDPDTCAGVQWMRSSKVIGAEDTTSPFTQSFDTTVIPNGTWSIRAMARCTLGSTGEASPVSINIQNPIGAGPYRPLGKWIESNTLSPLGTSVSRAKWGDDYCVWGEDRALW